MNLTELDFGHGFGNVAAGDRAVELVRAAGLADQDDGQTLHTLGDVFGFLPPFEVVGLQLRAAEAPGGLVAASIGLDDQEQVSLDLGGSGVLRDWQSKLSLVVGERATADGQLTFALATPMRVDAALMQVGAEAQP